MRDIVIEIQILNDENRKRQWEKFSDTYKENAEDHGQD